ncbi:CTD nuclear envelope phosphatase 1 [Grifola frondosa]|uniref:Mitochondrial import inner membrane translocase subunit TIM50 n=1 Tax=Grifola frondosa TaxID=5627 RepID=A0A1C7MK23_GRIFR|nr:CTD nuclear envelope phosphatase 1 [Grifola frondosa]
MADEVAVEDGSDEDEKDTEDESKDEKPNFPQFSTPPPVPTPEALTQTTVAPATHAGGTSRSSTPTLATHKTPFHLPKTLVLDLDETLIHSNRGQCPPHRAARVFLDLAGGIKRPFVDYFLRKVSGWYTLVIFTASMQEYADPVIDWLDAGRGILGRRLFREACTQLPNGSYTKDLQS